MRKTGYDYFGPVIGPGPLKWTPKINVVRMFQNENRIQPNNPLRPIIITNVQFTVLKSVAGLAIRIADGKISEKGTHTWTAVSISSAVTDIRAQMIDGAKNLSLSKREIFAKLYGRN
ncbi:hypothetical protein RF11_01786 [Thelohanellus kitauei]|uniref:Uncharacterized protein n=1 Tax=Thelohanellus kitauei TaxID=669202 RepID=A0A0C2IQK9_THEKT|nr:hypothetical protein RF11_01786 [Thelohanellus kitauei]